MPRALVRVRVRIPAQPAASVHGWFPIDSNLKPTHSHIAEKRLHDRLGFTPREFHHIHTNSFVCVTVCVYVNVMHNLGSGEGVCDDRWR